MFKNTASQKIPVLAWNTITDEPKTGDAANITAQISKDGAATAATNDTNPTELDATDAKGVYLFDMLQAETNADLVVLSPVSSTAGIQLTPVFIFTKLTAAAINAEVDAALNTAIPGSPTADSINQRVAAVDDLTQASGAGDLAAMDGKIDTIDTVVDAIFVDVDAMATGGSAPSLE